MGPGATAGHILSAPAVSPPAIGWLSPGSWVVCGTCVMTATTTMRGTGVVAPPALYRHQHLGPALSLAVCWQPGVHSILPPPTLQVKLAVVVGMGLLLSFIGLQVGGQRGRGWAGILAPMSTTIPTSLLRAGGPVAAARGCGSQPRLAHCTVYRMRCRSRVVEPRPALTANVPAY